MRSFFCSLYYYLSNQIYIMLQYSTLNFKHIVKSDYLNEDVVNLIDKTFVIPDEYEFNIFEVTERYIARPDLVSQDAYGDTMFTDVICKLNGISNPFELNTGMKLVIPSPEYITEFTVEPSNIDKSLSDPEIEENIPMAKDKRTKRKANESIVGDMRFKIDSSTGIIVY